MTDIIFHGISFNATTRDVRRFTHDQVHKELSDPDVFSWMDIQGPSIEPLNQVLKSLNIDLVLISHFETPEVLPRIIEHPKCVAFYIYEVLTPDKHLDTSHGLSELDFGRTLVVLGADFILTYHRKDLDAVESIKDTCVENFRLAGRTPGFILFLFLERCLYDYAHLNLANDNYLDLLEADVLTGSSEELAEKISVAGLNILTLKKMAASLHIVLMLLVTKRSQFVSSEARESFREMLQNVIAIRDAVDSSRDLLDGILHSIGAAAATRTNEIAKVLTVVSAIILPLSFIAGIYGMNFQYMPELNTRFGYFTVLAIMAGIGLFLIYLFRKLGWIGRNKLQQK